MRHFPPRASLAAGLFFLLTACATIGPPRPPSLELPKPPTDLRATRKGEQVTLTWTVPIRTTDRQIARNIGATRICRGLEPELQQCGTPVGSAAPPRVEASGKKVTASYADQLPTELEGDDTSAFVTYAIEVLNGDGRGAGLSNQVRVATIRALPPPLNFAAQVAKPGVVLTWTSNAPTPPSAQIRYDYRVYRSPQASQERVLVGEVPAAAEGASLTLTDSSIEWEKTYEYRAETVTLTDEPKLAIEGDDTSAVKVFADDIFPPAVPSGLQAVFSGPGQAPFIDLIWAPVPDVDLDGYNIYRREEGAAAVKVNAALVKTPAYRDSDVGSGKHYSYSVSAVDVRGNESARSEEAEESVP